jgi:hypothetical protein
MLHGMHFRVVEGEDMLDIMEEFEGDSDSDSGSSEEGDEAAGARGSGNGRGGAAGKGVGVKPSLSSVGAATVRKGEAKADKDSVDGDTPSALFDDSGESVASLLSAHRICNI